jgi:hypothetical protein
VREIRMLRAMRRGLETGLRWLLNGHEGGNPGYSQGAAYGLPRQFPTLPVVRTSSLKDCSPDQHTAPFAGVSDWEEFSRTTIGRPRNYASLEFWDSTGFGGWKLQVGS